LRTVPSELSIPQRGKRTFRFRSERAKNANWKQADEQPDGQVARVSIKIHKPFKGRRSNHEKTEASCEGVAMEKG